MPGSKPQLKTCPKGHQYYKSSDCPTCPICEAERKPKDGFMASLAAPARRALENAGIKTVQHLSRYTEKKILELHGMGPSSIPKLKAALKQEGLKFKD
jgi:DNA-directed RNA polymerase alpha subunit